MLNISRFTSQILCILVVMTTLSCSKTIHNATLVDQELLDTLVVSAPRMLDGEELTLPTYQATTPRSIDLLHTKIEVSFDWEKEQVIGKTTLDFTPLFYPVKSIALDAKNFDVKSVSLQGRDLDYTYDGKQILVNLDKTYTKGEEIQLIIDYIAKPSEGEISGSSAITSNRGLFFINAQGRALDKPTQVWSQGETEYNSRWFPTIDKPNERCTQELYITVPDTLVTLSNGLLISSKNLPGNLRQDYWKQDLPHAPYLFMLAVGKYAVVQEVSNNLPISYYVYPEYAEYAKQIFNHTPEMIQFFGEILGYPYPWDKYAQIIAEDYVSGAMENTTAVIFGEFVQNDSRTLVDEPNDKIVAHEMFHHWFGDLVTCESWSNLTMNEGFANYGEYLWMEHKYGQDAAEEHRISELQSYVASTNAGGTHDLIHFGYTDMEDMFDAHSYNKGGLVLHMLRNKVGDAAFFASLSRYLHKHEFTAVEAHDLRLAFEEVTGLDLTTFFNQWYFSPGHPTLEIAYAIRPGQLSIGAKQVQVGPNHLSIYVLDVEPIVYYTDGSSDTLTWNIKQREAVLSYNYPAAKTVAAVVFDGSHDVLGEIYEAEQGAGWYRHLLQYSGEYQDIVTSIEWLDEPGEELLAKLKTHDYGPIREMAMTKYQAYYSLAELKNALTSDVYSGVRAEALNTLVLIDEDNAEAVAKIGMKDESYRVQSEAIYALYEVNPQVVRPLIDSLLAVNPLPYVAVIGDIKSVSPNAGDLPFYREYLPIAIDRGIYYILTDYLRVSIETSMMESAKTYVHLMAMKNQATDFYNTYIYTKASDSMLEYLDEALPKYKGEDKEEIQQMLEQK